MLCLTPQQFEEVVNADFLGKTKLGRLANMIFNNASEKELRDGRYNKTTTILCECFPEYYYATRREISLMELFDAPQDLISNMSAIGKSKKSETSRETVNMGAIVDNAIYEAWKECLPSILPGIGGKVDANGKVEVQYSPDERLDAFIELDKPRSRVSDKGSAKIIKNRKNFQTLLDFYFLKSPEGYQKENLHLYYIAKLVTGSLDKNPMAKMMFEYEKMKSPALRFCLETKMVEQFRQRHFPVATKTRNRVAKKTVEPQEKKEPVIDTKEDNESMEMEIG